MLLASVLPSSTCYAGCSTSPRHHRTHPSSRLPLLCLLPRLAASNAPPLRRSVLAKPRARAPFPCRRTSHAPQRPRPPTASRPRSRRHATTPFPSRSAASRGSLRATPRPMFHLQPRTRPPAAPPTQATGAPISFNLRLSPPPPPALPPAPTPRLPLISHNLRIPLRPPRRLPSHPARQS